MLFHLFSPHANGYVTLPTGTDFTVSRTPTAGTVMDLCGENGLPIDRGMRFGANNSFVQSGEDTLENNDIVTIGAPNNRFVRPVGTDIVVQNVTARMARFRIRKLSGGGRTIRHGDTVALGALQPYDARRGPQAQQYRWLQADPDDSNPSTKEVILGGRSLNPGGESQRFLFLEANLVAATARLKVSDAMPGETMPTGTLDIRLSHEGLPNGSTVNVRFTALNGQSFRFGSSGLVVTPPFNMVHPVRVPAGSNAVSVPLTVVSPTMSDPVARFYEGGGLGNPEPNSQLGELSVVDAGMFFWNGFDRDGASPRPTAIDSERLGDYLRLNFDRVLLGSRTVGAIIRASAPTPRLVVSAGPRRLPPFPGGRYYFAVSVQPFPEGAHTNQIVAQPLVDPILTLSADGRFTRTVTFAPIPSPVSPEGFDRYSVHVFIGASGAPNPMRPILVRRFGLTVLP